VEAQRGLRMHGKVVALGAVVVREEAETARVRPLEQHDACMRTAVADRRERHRGRFRIAGRARLREQVVESGERGSMERRGIRVFRDIRHARGC
jgi:hypothetical protein